MNFCLTEYGRALASDPAVIRAARTCARCAARRRPDLAAEFESGAMLAVCVAAATYAPGRGDWPGWAAGAVAWSVHHTLRAMRPRGYRNPRDRRAAVPAVWGEPPDVPDADDPVGWSCEWSDLVETLAGAAPPASGRVFRAYYLDAGAATLGAAGRRFGLGVSGAHYNHARALAAVRARAAEALA